MKISEILHNIKQHSFTKENSAEDATFLLLDILQKSRTIFLTNPQYELSETELVQWQEKYQKLQSGVPLAYITGNQPFWSLDFFVNEHTLIPRSDTEILIDHVLSVGDNLSQDKEINNLSMLDMGTGSGIVAICCKHERPQWSVTATDYSEQALVVAEQNAIKNKTDIQFLQGSWYGALQNTQKFHIIASNPPYIEENDVHLADLSHEPLSALVAPNNGLADIESIVASAPKHLHDGGWLLIEHGFDQAEAVHALFTQHKFTSVCSKKDLGNNDRITIGCYTV